MNRRLAITLVAVIIIAIWSFVKLDLRNYLVDEEESEIKNILDAVYQAEAAYYRENQTYSSDIGAFELIKTKKPILVGVIRDCEDTSSTTAYVFLGPHNVAFHAQAQKSMQEEISKIKCRSLKSGFTAFASQNIDVDDDLETWSINELEHYDILTED